MMFFAEEAATTNSANPHLKRLVVFFVSLLNWLLLSLIWGLFWYYNYRQAVFRLFYFKGNLFIVFVYGLLLLLFYNFYGGFRVGYYKLSNVTLSGCIAVSFTNLITWMQICLMSGSLARLNPFLLMTFVDYVVVVLWTAAAHAVYLKLYPPRRLLVIHGNQSAADSLIAKMIARRDKYEICETVFFDGDSDSLREMIVAYDSVLLCDLKAGQRNRLVKYCYEHSVRVYLTPKISDIILRGAVSVNLFDTPLLLCRNQSLPPEQAAAKRSFDILFSALVLLVFSPLMLFTAAAIRLGDGGPVFYKQTRLTRDGKNFEIYKFRSMRVDAEKQSGIRLAGEHDDRITPVGRIIRKLRIDELPQFLNIIKGDMSVVGPRPERPEIAAEYEKQMPEFSFRLKMKAGLTGYAQVYGKYNTTPYDKLKLDLMYIANFTPIEDIRLILLTIKVVFSRESTEGIGDNMTTAQRTHKEMDHV